MGDAGLAAECEHDRVVRERDGAAAERRVPDEDELTGAELVIVPVDGEARAAAEDEVDLLVAEGRLGVLLDDPAGRSGGVRVHAERADVELPPDRPPFEAVVQLDPVELVDVHVAHRKSSRQRGSACRRARSPSSAAYLPTIAGARSYATRRCSNAASPSPASASKHAALYGPCHVPGWRASVSATIARPWSTLPAARCANAT